jgi:hypothetical protein
MMETINRHQHAKVRYVDWGGAVIHRSFGDERIEGDIWTHYGLEARLVAVQMVANQLEAMPA